MGVQYRLLQGSMTPANRDLLLQIARKPSNARLKQERETMHYDVGSRVQVKLSSGEYVIALILSISLTSAWPTVRISFGGKTVEVSPDQIIKVFS
jgi:hypothetical protein